MREMNDRHVIFMRIRIAAHTHQPIDNYCYYCYYCIHGSHYARVCLCWNQRREGYSAIYPMIADPGNDYSESSI